jgi:hypothetical protein
MLKNREKGGALPRPLKVTSGGAEKVPAAFFERRSTWKNRISS